MGVRHLQTFIENPREMPNGKKNISILKEIENYKRKFPMKKPLIVVDYMGFCHMWQPKEEILCGFRAKVYCNRVRNFFSKLKETGVDLAFFIDGPVQKDKKETWFNRRDFEYQKCISILDEIAKNTPLPEIIYYKSNQIAAHNLTHPLMKEVVKEFGSIFTIRDVECDLALAAYATENQALAIFANDTDFLIYPGNWKYWSIKDISEEMKTVEYNRNALRSTLGLSQSQLPLFATLGGNDIVHYDDVQGFHYSIGNRNKFRNLANFVRNIRINTFTDEELLNISKIVFRHRRGGEEFVEAMKASLASYDYDTIKNVEHKCEYNDPFYQRLLFENNSIVLCNLMEYKLSVQLVYQDLRDFAGERRNYTHMFLDINRRMEGIIIKHRQNANRMRHYYLKESHEEGYKAINVPPIFPEVNIPWDMLKSIVHRESENDGLDNIRFELYSYVFHNSFDGVKLFKLDSNFIPLLASLAFLIKESLMTVDEADIFVISINDVINDRAPDDLKPPIFLNLRAFKLNFLFLKTYHHAFKCFDLLGLQKWRVPTVFDGVYYHVLQQKWNVMNANMKEEKLEEIKDKREIYWKL